ncbi:unnamed protein product [Wickerhamomyces anomalus]
MSMFFKSPLDLEIRLDGEDSRKQVEIKSAQGKKDKYPLYEDGETISGAVTVRVKDGKRVEHTGIKAQLFGSIEIANGQKDDFLCLSHDLASAAELDHSETYNFSFKDVEKRYESYKGKNLNVNYYVKITVLRKSADITKVKKFWVYIYPTPTDLKKSIKLDIGIENCLHIEFEYSKSTYSLKDTVGNVPNQLTDSNTVRYEIMDGSPVKGETIPIRLFLGGYELTPTTKTNMFNVKNYLSLVIIDEDGRRYFKQSEVVLFRSK